MRLKSKNKDIVRHIHRLFMQESFYEMCNEIWYYGEFDFFYDYLRHIKYKYKDEGHRHWCYTHMTDIFFNKHYNANLLNPISGDERKNDYLDFLLGKEVLSIKEMLNN